MNIEKFVYDIVKLVEHNFNDIKNDIYYFFMKKYLLKDLTSKEVINLIDDTVMVRQNDKYVAVFYSPLIMCVYTPTQVERFMQLYAENQDFKSTMVFSRFSPGGDRMQYMFTALYNKDKKKLAKQLVFPAS